MNRKQSAQSAGKVNSHMEVCSFPEDWADRKEEAYE